MGTSPRMAFLNNFKPLRRISAGSRFGTDPHLDYIEGNLAQKITIKELADVAGISMFHFCRVFKKATNQTPYQYVCSRRLLNAQLLMANGQNSLAEIGLSCGFSSQAHFTNAFLKETGMPPGRYRRMMINN